MMASPKTCLLFATLLLLTTQVYSHFEGHTCDHDDIEQNPGLLDIEEDLTAFGENRHLASASKIRIYTHYGFLQSTASSSYVTYIQDLVAPMIDYFQSAISVKAPVVGNLKLGTSVRKICERSTPSILTGEGVSSDVFFYIDSQSISSTQIANTMYCYLSSGTKRPLVVRTMINRSMMPANSDVVLRERDMYVLMHELMHGLGFSNYQFPNFIDANGNRKTGHLKKIKYSGVTHTVLDVEPLTQKLKDFYGCPSLEGAVLENGGGSSTDGSHFERKYFVYEAMSSGSIVGRRVSQFSLALLEGSGWYNIDYSFAEPFYFGQGQGCPFVRDTCTSNNAKFNEYCEGSSRGCAPHGRGGGNCRSDSISEGCKYYSPDPDYDCENEDGLDYAPLPELQSFGRDTGSKCFSGTLSTLRQNPTIKRSFCFKYACTGSGSDIKLELTVGSNKLVCTKEGTLTISGYNGVVNCPDPVEYCGTLGKKYCPRNCMGRGTCSNGKCVCKSGFKGVDCAIKA
jgi:hypothetical protein